MRQKIDWQSSQQGFSPLPHHYYTNQGTEHMLPVSDAAQIIRCWDEATRGELMWGDFGSDPAAVNGGGAACVEVQTSGVRKWGAHFPPNTLFKSCFVQRRRQRTRSECQRGPAAVCWLSSGYINCTSSHSRENKADQYSQSCREVRKYVNFFPPHIAGMLQFQCNWAWGSNMVTHTHQHKNHSGNWNQGSWLETNVTPHCLFEGRDSWPNCYFLPF